MIYSQVKTDEKDKYSCAYDRYNKKLNEYINTICEKKCMVKDKDLYNTLCSIEDILRKISRKLDWDNCSEGIFPKLIDYYLPTFIDSLNQYAELQSLTEVIDVKKRIDEIKKNIYLSKAIYTNMLKELVDVDVMEMSVNEDVYKKVAVADGLLSDVNTLPHKQS